MPAGGPPIDSDPKPLDRRTIDDVEKASSGSDTRLNQDYSCLPQDETCLDVNPRPAEHRRRCERLPARHGLVGLLRDDRQREPAGTTGSFRSRRPARRQRRGLHRLAAAIRPSPTTEPASSTTRSSASSAATTRAASSSTVDERRLHLVARVRRRSAAPRTTPDGASCGAPSDPRQPGDGTVQLQAGQRRPPERQRRLQRQGVASPQGRGPPGSPRMLRAGPRRRRGACDPGTIGVDRALRLVDAVPRDRRVADHPQLLRRSGTFVVAR